MRALRLLLCLLLAACGSATRSADEGPPPERAEREGQPVQLDGAAGIGFLTEQGGSLVAVVDERRSGLPPECRRYSEVRVLAQTGATVELAAYAYRPTWDVEPQCPLVEGDPATHTVALREPLGERDVVLHPGGPPVHVQARAVPGRTPVRGTRSCGTASIVSPFGSVDYAHFIRHAGRTYVSQGPTTGAVLDAPLGTIRCTLSESLTPFRYEPVDGDAGFVDAGSTYSAVSGRPVDEAIGAVWDGAVTVFELRP